MEAVCKLENCIADISSLMFRNKLKLNEGKTEFLIIGRKAHCQILSNISFKVSDTVPNPVLSVRNLGVQFDKILDMIANVQNVCKVSYAKLRNIARLGKFVFDEVAATMVHAFVVSRLDFCNSLLIGLPDTLIHKLQRV